jgi:hypothetical protein
MILVMDVCGGACYLKRNRGANAYLAPSDLGIVPFYARLRPGNATSGGT